MYTGLFMNAFLQDDDFVSLDVTLRQLADPKFDLLNLPVISFVND